MAISKSDLRYSKSGLWLLYIATAFPMHLWAIILILMDISWVAERTDYWDAVGVAAYGLMFILFESIVVWGLLILLGLILPKVWSEYKRITLLGTWMVVTSLWAIFGQLFFLLEWSFPAGLIQYLAGTHHPLRLLYLGYIGVVAFTVIGMTYISIFVDRFQGVFINIIEKLSPLMGMYLFLDVAGILVVILRNIG